MEQEQQMMDFISEETFERALSNEGKPHQHSPFHAIELCSASDTSLSFSWDFIFDDKDNKHSEFEYYKCTASDDYGFIKSQAQAVEPKCTLNDLIRGARYVVRIFAVFRNGHHVVEAPVPIDVPSLTTYATSSLDDFCNAVYAKDSGVSQELFASCEEAQVLFTCRSDLSLEELSTRLAALRALWDNEVGAAIQELDNALDSLRLEDADKGLIDFVSEANSWVAELRAHKYDFKKLKIKDIQLKTQEFKKMCNECAVKALRLLEETLNDFCFQKDCEGAKMDQFEKDEIRFRGESVFYEACREMRAWVDDVNGDSTLLNLHAVASRRRDLLALWKNEANRAIDELITAANEMSGDVTMKQHIEECLLWAQQKQKDVNTIYNQQINPQHLYDEHNEGEEDDVNDNDDGDDGKESESESVNDNENEINTNNDKDDKESENNTNNDKNDKESENSNNDNQNSTEQTNKVDEENKAEKRRDKRDKRIVFGEGKLISTALAKKEALRRIWDVQTAMLRLNRAMRSPTKNTVVKPQDLGILNEAETNEKTRLSEKVWDEEVSALKNFVDSSGDQFCAGLSPVVSEMEKAEAKCPGSAICTPEELAKTLLNAQEHARADAMEALCDETRLMSTEESSKTIRTQCAAIEEWLLSLSGTACTEATAAEALQRRKELYKQWADVQPRPVPGTGMNEDDSIVFTTCASIERRQAAEKRKNDQSMTAALFELERCLATYGKEETIAEVSTEAVTLLENARSKKEVTKQELLRMCNRVMEAWNTEVSSALLDLEVTVSRYISGKNPITARMCQDTIRWIEVLKADMDPCFVTGAAIRARKEGIVRCWKLEATRALLELKHAAQSYIFSDDKSEVIAGHIAWADVQFDAMNSAVPTVDVTRAVDARKEIENTWHADMERALSRLEEVVCEYRAVPGNPVTERKCAGVEAEIAAIREEPYPGSMAAGDIEALGREIRGVWLRERRSALIRLERAVRKYRSCKECAGDVTKAQVILEASDIPDSEAKISDTEEATTEKINNLIHSIEDTWKASTTSELERLEKLSSENWPEVHAWAKAHRNEPFFDPRLVTAGKVSKKCAELKKVATSVASERLSDLDTTLTRISMCKDVCATQNVREAQELSAALHGKMDNDVPVGVMDLGSIDAAIRSVEDMWTEIAVRADLRCTMERLSLCGKYLRDTASTCADVRTWLRSQQALTDLGSGNESEKAVAEAHSTRNKLLTAWTNEICESIWNPYAVGGNPNVAVDGRTVTRTSTSQIFGSAYAKVLGDRPASFTRVSKWVFHRPSVQNVSVLPFSSSGKILVGLIPLSLVADNYDNDDLWKKYGWFISLKDLTKCHAKVSEKYGHDFVAPGDTISMRLDPIEGTLSFALNGISIGVAFRDVRPDVPLFPAVLLPDKGDALELLTSITYSSRSLDLGKDYTHIQNQYTPLQLQREKQDNSQQQQQQQQRSRTPSLSPSPSPSPLPLQSPTKGDSGVKDSCYIKNTKESITFTKPHGYESFIFNSGIPLPRGCKTRWAVHIKPTSSARVYVGVKRVTDNMANTSKPSGGGEESLREPSNTIYLDCSTSVVLGLPADTKVAYKTRVKSGDLVSVEADTKAGILTFYVNFKPLSPPVTFMSPSDQSNDVMFIKSTVLFKTGDIVEIYH